MTVTWTNIKIFKIKNVGRPPCWKLFAMPYLAYQWTNWDAAFCGRIPSRSRHVRHVAVAMATAGGALQRRTRHSAVTDV